MYSALLLLTVTAGVCHGSPKTATCELSPNNDIGELTDRVSGTVTFTEEKGGKVRVTGDLEGFNTADTYALHGFHVHADSDIAASCSGAAGHYNPHGKQHGAPTDAVRHVGDLGNIEEDSAGKVSLDITDSMIMLTGDESIIGRAVVVHEKADDLGKGGDEGSKKTGNAGGRLACCVIVKDNDDDGGANGGAARRGNAVLASAFGIVLAIALWL